MNTNMRTNAVGVPSVVNNGHEAEETGRWWSRIKFGDDDRFEPAPGHTQPPLFSRADVSGRRIANANDAADEVAYFLTTDIGKQLVKDADLQRVRGSIHIEGNQYVVSTEDPTTPFLEALFAPKWEFIVDPAVGRVTAFKELSIRTSLFGSLERDPVGRY